MAITGVRQILQRINGTYERRRAALYALSLQYAARALNDFRAKQSQNVYWLNRTGSARDLVFSDAYLQESMVGWFIAHGVEYGVYLELANDGQNQALRPTVEQFAQAYFEDARKLFEG